MKRTAQRQSRSLIAEGGFTLIEIIVSLTILGIGFSALFAGMSQSARNIHKIQTVERRETFVRNLLAELDLVRQLRAGDNASGAFEDGTRWKLEIQPYIVPAAENAPRVLRIELRLNWDGSAGILSKTIETYRLVPTTDNAAPNLEEQLHVLQ